LSAGGGSSGAPGGHWSSRRIALRIMRLALLSSVGSTFEVMTLPFLSLAMLRGWFGGGLALRFVDPTPVFRVVRGLPQTRRIVVEISKARVASEAKEAAALVELVTVINAKPLLGLSFADCTSAVLPRKNVVVVRQRHPVSRLEMGFAFMHAATSKPLRPEFGLCCISVPTPRVELRPMGLSVGAGARFLSFSFL
jgi:hypothetical protein